MVSEVRGPENPDWSGPLSLRGLTTPVSPRRAPPLVGGCPPRAAERVRARPHAAVVPARSVAHTRSQWVSGEPRRSPRGGGAGAAWQPPYGSVEPPPASGIGAAGSARQRPALQRVRTSRFLPPSLRLPASRALTAEEMFSREALRLGRGLKPPILARPKARPLLRLPLAQLGLPPHQPRPGSR